MSRISKFLFIYRLPVINVLMALFIFMLPHNLFPGKAHTDAVDYYLGVLLVAGMFLEMGGIHYKSVFIYSRVDPALTKVPFWLNLGFFPRVIVALIITGIMTRGLGWMEKSDFVLLVIIFVAFFKEFWVRTVLMNPEYAGEEKLNLARIWMGEIMLFLYLCIVYVCAWELYLNETPGLLRKMQHPVNYPFFGAAFLAAYSALVFPWLVEEYFRSQSRRVRIIITLSFLIPLAAFIYDIMRAGIAFHAGKFNL